MLLPREHGAYGQLLAPLATALAIGRPGTGSLAWAAAAAGAFLAHEPLLVLLGQRGQRAARDERRRAWRWLLGYGAAAAASGAVAVASTNAAARSSMVLPLALAAALTGVIAARREHTAAGEILSAVTMATLAWPAALAAGAAPLAARSGVLVFAASFVAATLAVRAIIASTRQPPATVQRAAAGLVAAGTLVAFVWLARLGLVHGSAALAALPMCAAAAGLALAAPTAKRLRTVGWVLMTATGATAAVLIVSLRLAA